MVPSAACPLLGNVEFGITNMDVQLWTWILVGISFTLYFGIAIWARASSTKDFYIAGGGVSPLANGMATAADWMSAASFISMAGLPSPDPPPPLEKGFASAPAASPLVPSTS